MSLRSSGATSCLTAQIVIACRLLQKTSAPSGPANQKRDYHAARDGDMAKQNADPERRTLLSGQIIVSIDTSPWQSRTFFSNPRRFCASDHRRAPRTSEERCQSILTGASLSASRQLATKIPAMTKTSPTINTGVTASPSITPANNIAVIGLSVR